VTVAAAPVEAAKAASEASPGERPPGEPRLVGYLYLLPAFAVFACFVLYPLYRAAYISLYEWDGLTVGTWTGLSNYADVFTDEDLRSAFVHALILLLFYSVLPILIGLALAGVMARARVRGLAFFRAVLFLPQVIAMVVVALMWKMIYQPGDDGALNRVLGWFGIESKSWLGDFNLALPAVGLVGTYVYFGLAMVLLTAGVQKIPTSLYDAARVDGAGPVREFFAVTLPGLRNEIVVAFVLTTINALRSFDIIYNTNQGGPGTQTYVPSLYVYQNAFVYNRVGYAAAIAVLLAAAILAVALLVIRVGGDRR